MSNHTWTLAAVNRTGLPALPHDLLLHIYAFLDVPGAVALSETCRSLHGFAMSRAAWLTLARTLAASRALALPAEKQLTTIPADLTTDEMRAVVQQTTKVAININLPNPVLSPISSLVLPEPATIVHSSLLPGGRFLLTAQNGGTFACWDLATTELVSSSQPPSFPRRRSMRTQTNSVDGVDVEMGSESDNDMHPEYDNNSPGDELRRPRCVAAWEAKAEYVEFAYDLVPGGVVVALMVAVQVGHNPPILKRDMYVVRIDLPTSTTPVPVPPGQYPGPPNPFSIPTAPPLFAGRYHGLGFIAHSPIRQPVFISTTFINASGHAGILGDIPDTMVVFILLFDPNAPSSPSLSPQPSLTHPIQCATSLVHCGFKVAPGTRHTALGTSTHVLLYAESTLKTIARRIEVQPLRRRWAASIVPITTPIQCVDLGVKVLGTPRFRDFIGSPGTEGAPLFTTVRAMLRKANPKWLLQELTHASAETTDPRMHRHRGRRAGPSRKKGVPETVCALGLSVDVEDRRADIFRGLVLGAHDVAPDSEEEPDGSDEDEGQGTSMGSRSRAQLAPGNVLSTLADSYSLPTPSQSSLLEPTQTDTSSSSSSSSPVLPLRRPFRRACRVRYKRTIFPAHVNYAHELAGMGSFGRYAAWIEGDGVPEEVDWQKEPLRVMVAPLMRETGAEEYPELANQEPDKAETAIRQSAASLTRVLSVPGVFQPKLNMVSCLAFEDAAGVLALSTVDGQVHVFGLAT